MTNHTESTPSYYAIIPAHVRYCKDLEMGARLLYGEITALSNQSGYCWAKNEYFSQLYDVDDRTIRRWIDSLKNHKFIAVEISEGRHRKLWISREIQKVFNPDKNVRVPGQKCPADNIYNNTSSNSNAASQLSDFLLKKIKSIKPDFTKEVSPKWIKDFERLIKIRSEEQLKKIIEWVFESSFWESIVHSPSSIIKNIDKIEMQMTKNTNNGPKQWIEKLKELVKDRSDIHVGDESIVFSGGQSQIIIKLTHQVQIVERFKKMGIPVEGL